MELARMICGTIPPRREFISSAQNVSLEALTAFIASDAFQAPPAAGQIRIIVAALVRILAQSTTSLAVLKSKYPTLSRAKIDLNRMSGDNLSPRERRRSFFTQEATAVQSGTPRSSMQVDFTEEQNSVLALKNLKLVCEMNNASLIRTGLDSLMDELASLNSSNSTDDYPAWTVDLVTLVLSWLSIQHRYLTVIASLEDLDLPGLKKDKSISSSKQELMLTIVEGILTTGESLIGLNVIDILNSLIERIAIQINTQRAAAGEVVQKLVNCIIGLAGHTYYSDQISDMCSAITEWSRPLFAALNRVSGKESPAIEGDDDALNVKTGAIWSLRALKGVLEKRAESVSLEEVWSGTEGGLAGRDGDVRMEYVDALVTHLRSEHPGDDEKNVPSSIQFLTMIHVPIFYALRSPDATAPDYWSIWVLLLVLLEKFKVKEVTKALPMIWRLLDIAPQTLTCEARTCIEAIFLGFLAVASELFQIPELKSSASKVCSIE